jgi:DNA-directed RNA polymerase subunit M/transcription elongation factor TFIIS|tara:strand:+ start:22940 stop:23176 length:237 start_codon:yes stop_codon:yes gene_type:complete
MYGCPNCNSIFEPVVSKTVATEAFISCPECGFSRALESDVWQKNAKAPEPKVSGDEGIAKTKAKAKAKPKVKANKKKK